MVHVQLDGFQRVEQQRLTHDAQVVAQRIQYPYAMLGRIAGQSVVIGRFGQRVAHDLVETVGGQHVRQQVDEPVAVGMRSV